VINRRKDKRFEQENKVNILFTPLERTLSGNETVEALTYNLSLSGAKIVTTKIFPVDSIIRADIHLSGTQEVVRVDGQVKWVHEVEEKDRFVIGVEFLHEISKTLLSLIKHLYSVDEGLPSEIGQSPENGVDKLIEGDE
jgi:c-di-GMP-binding flagellar brake protein YcgR